MKFNLITLIIASTVSLSITSASAADGKINFVGEITDDACTVTNNIANPLNVNLGKVSSKSFSAPGDNASPTKFTISLSGCPSTVNSAVVKFDGNANPSDNTILALTQETGVATGVGIQLTTISNEVIPLYQSSPEFTLKEGDNNLDFIARYYATAKTVTSGPANSTSNFTIVYN